MIVIGFTIRHSDLNTTLCYKN